MTQVRPLYLPPPYQDAVESGRLILRDGTTATIRVAQPDDQDALRAFFEHLSPESKRLRFFSLATPRVELLRSLCDSSDPRRQLSLLVIRRVGGADRIIATGSYMAIDAQTAEVAFAVGDAFHGKGLGSLLLERLAILAARQGLLRFWALTDAQNRPMVEVFSRSGFQLNKRLEDGYLHVEFSVVPSEASVARSEMLDQVFTTASLRPFFRPRSVAVVGASRDPASIGYRILEALILNRFQGPVYPVNPRAAVVGSMRAYPSVQELPESIDLAIVVVPRNVVLEVVDGCAERGVRALVVITAGFAEADPIGHGLQSELLKKVRGYGMRMVGPNCMGLLNTDPEVRLNASFSPVFPSPGGVAMASQSGALGLAILTAARRLDLGLSTFVSMGNKADVSSNDLLQYWEEDEQTRVILLYLESFGNPRRFSRIARRVSRRKPIVAVKGGRTQAGRRAAGSHTAALAASDVAVSALFRQTGVIRADALEEMFDLAAALGSQPLPGGRQVGIVTNAGGPGILCADACEVGGLQVPELSGTTKARLAAFLPASASLQNPVDMIASAGPDHYRQTIETILASDEIDALVIIYIPVGMFAQEAMEGVVVQPMVSGGVEVIVGVAQDPLFGPLIAFGLGGVHVEILGDVCFRVTPLTDRDAREMVREIRGYRLLEGFRGHPPADIPAIEEILLRLSLLVEEVPEISELDLNPIFALPPGQGCRIVDARIRVESPDKGSASRSHRPLA